MIEVDERVASIALEVAEVRRDLHAHPELGFEEIRTAKIVAERLAKFGCEVTSGIAGTGVVGTLHGRASGRSIALRADMDALPMSETSSVPHASRHPGKMHACGHDGHVAMLLGAAQRLAETRNFSGTVHFIFQPAEEGLGGAKRMVEEGLFDRFPCEAIFGLHNWPELPVGKIGLRAGAMMAASDKFDIEIRGRGAHGAMPHFSVDPVIIASHTILAMQSVVSRNVDPDCSAVVSICAVEGGYAHTVIPDCVRLKGTARCFDHKTHDLLEERVRTIVTHTAVTFGGSATCTYDRYCPPTLNSAEETKLCEAVAVSVVGAENVISDIRPSMGAEDFAYFLSEKPGAYIWLGQGGHPASCMVHNESYDFNDEVIPLGIDYWVKLVEAALPLAPRRPALASDTGQASEADPA